MTSRTGRVLREGSKRMEFCQGCNARMTYGEPIPNDGWPGQMHLTKDQFDALLVAAAEFRELCAEAGEYESVVDFVDWVASALLPASVPDHDGGLSVVETGGSGRHTVHRHPDPIPYVGTVLRWPRR